jgi:hypothetical protein
VLPDAGAPGGGVPRTLPATADGGDKALREDLPEVLATVAARHADTLLRTDMGARWRGGMTHRDKLCAALAARLPASLQGEEASAVLASLLAPIDAAWSAS